ncbi:MAG: hypothetical protein LBH91_03090 [Prevotellaceae bacterium]|nr:hypothetical protein [Prevotellaceae bacterium]
MVTFNFNKPTMERSWTAIIEGDADEYLYTIRAMLRLLATQEQDFICRDDNYQVLNFIEQLLPEPKQLNS